MMENKTFIIIKPDAYYRGMLGKIISRFEDKGFPILKIELRRKNWFWCYQQYSHLPDDILRDVTFFMVGQPLIGIVLHAPIDVVRNMIGETNSLCATPGTIRGDYGSTPVSRNLIHASDSKEAMIHEMELFYDDATDYSR